MILYNKSKRNMYVVLKTFNNCNDIFKTQKLVCEKLKIDEITFAHIISECVSNYFFDGIKTTTSVSNLKYNIYSEHIYISYNGYEFLKNYHGFIKRIAWELFLIITTTLITIILTNYFSDTNQDFNTICDFASDNSTYIKVCNEPYD